MPVKTSPTDDSGLPDSLSAGRTDPRRGVRITGAERNSLRCELRSRYEQGLSIRDLAQETGRSYGFIHKVLVESETILRSRGGAHSSSALTPGKAGKSTFASDDSTGKP